MKKIFFVICLFILVGCTQKTAEVTDLVDDDVANDPVNVDVEEKIQTFMVDPNTFHFVADWLTNTKIVFVEKDQDFYYAKTFDIITGEIDTLVEESSIIVDVFIHPSKEKLLLHTTDDVSSASVKIISIEGVELESVSIASSELAIEWNDLDPSLILLTGFHPDWSFDVFLYSGHEERLDLLSIEDPFPKWIGTDIVASHVDGELLFYNHLTDEETKSETEDILHFDTYKDLLLTVQLHEENLALYSMIDAAGSVRSEWTMPAVRNDSEWVFSEVVWVTDTIQILRSVTKGGQLDELEAPYKLVRMVDGKEELIVENILDGPLRCSSDGEKCLTGYTMENLIDTITKEEVEWLLFSN